eukprot:IDg11977t1
MTLFMSHFGAQQRQKPQTATAPLEERLIVDIALELQVKGTPLFYDSLKEVVKNLIPYFSEDRQQALDFRNCRP